MTSKPLLIIAVIFAASFAGRAIGIADAALKRDDGVANGLAQGEAETAPGAILAEAATPAPQQSAEKKDQPDEHAAHATLELAEPISAAHKNEQISELLKMIRERSETLDKKSMQIEDRIRMLEIIEVRVEEKLAEFQKSNEELSKLVSYANEASREDIAMLAKMYEQMKPQRAGEIFNQMNPAFAAGFLTEMNSESAALILTNMSTDKAYEASMIIASRNAAVHQ